MPRPRSTPWSAQPEATSGSRAKGAQLPPRRANPLRRDPGITRKRMNRRGAQAAAMRIAVPALHNVERPAGGNLRFRRGAQNRPVAPPTQPKSNARNPAWRTRRRVANCRARAPQRGAPSRRKPPVPAAARKTAPLRPRHNQYPTRTTTQFSPIRKGPCSCPNRPRFPAIRNAERCISSLRRTDPVCKARNAARIDTEPGRSCRRKVWKIIIGRL